MPNPIPTLRRETRASTVTSLRIERRASGDGETAKPVIIGHASVFNSWTTLYESRYVTMREIVRPGAFKRAIAENQDVRALFNHDVNFVLGRTASGTLALREDGDGLMSETEAPDTPTIRDLVIGPIERGDIDGMSFAFTPRLSDSVTRTEGKDGTEIIERGGDRITIRPDGDRDIVERELLDVDLFDISIVTYPQYEGTDVGLRSALGIEEFVKEFDRSRKRSTPVRDELRRWLQTTSSSAVQVKPR
jgi:HK97 family phage prohead protease